MFVNRILLVDVQLEKLVMSCTFEVFEAEIIRTYRSRAGMRRFLRVELLKVRFNQPSLAYLDEATGCNAEKVSLGLQRAIVDLTDDLYDKGIVLG